MKIMTQKLYLIIEINIFFNKKHCYGNSTTIDQPEGQCVVRQYLHHPAHCGEQSSAH